MVKRINYPYFRKTTYVSKTQIQKKNLHFRNNNCFFIKNFRLCTRKIHFPLFAIFTYFDVDSSCKWNYCIFGIWTSVYSSNLFAQSTIGAGTTNSFHPFETLTRLCLDLLYFTLRFNVLYTKNTLHLVDKFDLLSISVVVSSFNKME